MYFVRATSIVRALSRYAERLVSHNATFHLLARLRMWTYSRIEPQAPAHLLIHRSGDMLARLVADIEELQNFYLQAVSPIVIALVISLFTFGIFSIFSMGLAWVALACLAVAGSGVLLLALALVPPRVFVGVSLVLTGLLIAASFAAVQPLAPAFQRLGDSRAAAEPVCAAADALPPVIESAAPQPVPADPGPRDKAGG